jgi:hypothetical protein
MFQQTWYEIMAEIYHPHKPTNCYDVMGGGEGGKTADGFGCVTVDR